MFKYRVEVSGGHSADMGTLDLYPNDTLTTRRTTVKPSCGKKKPICVTQHQITATAAPEHREGPRGFERDVVRRVGGVSRVLEV